MRQWLADLVLGHIKLFSTELFWKKNPFFTQFLAKFYSNYFLFLFIYIFFISLQLKKIFSNSLICPKAKSATHCLTELFSIFQNKHGIIRRRDDHIVVQSSHRNIFKIDWFLHYKLKSDNRQYDTLGWWVHGMIVSSAKCLMFQVLFFCIISCKMLLKNPFNLFLIFFLYLYKNK